MIIDSFGKILENDDYFVISDTHFFDENLVTKRDRKNIFASIEDMNETIITKWNSVVSENDNVLHLGDVYHSYDVSLGELTNLLNRLNGNIYVAIGNNDNVDYLAKSERFQSIHLWFRDYKNELILSHSPLAEMSFKCYGDNYTNIHGHTHIAGSPRGDYINVSADVIKFKPVNIGQLLNF